MKENDNASLLELALSCQKDFKGKINETSNRKYCDTTFFSINEGGIVQASERPEIFADEDVCQCLMIHHYSEKAVSRWYSWYTIQFIDERGSVHLDSLDEKFKIYVNYNGCFSNQWLYLSFKNKSIFSCSWPNNSKIQIVWDLYQQCRKAQTDREVQLIGDLTMMDETILSLKGELANSDYANILLTKERDQYKSLLDEIKQIIRNR